MNRGKDIKIGDDKRPVSIIPNSEQFLYNIANGEILTDEYGTPLVTEVDTFFGPDASKKRATSVVFGNVESQNNSATDYSLIGITTGVYGNFEVDITNEVLKTDTSTVGFGLTVLLSNNTNLVLQTYPFSPELEVRVREHQGGEQNRVYFADDVGINKILGASVGDSIQGKDIPPQTFISNITYNSRVILTNDILVPGVQSNDIKIQRATTRGSKEKFDITWKIAETFKDTSEVSSSLLGIPRAETQLGLFSNVSSYGLDSNEFEYYTWNDGYSFSRWDRRRNEVYGNRYSAQLTEEVQESALKLTAFPVPYSFPFGPKFDEIGQYDSTLFPRYINFIQLGNDLYDYFSGPEGSSYPSDWKNKFLDPQFGKVVNNDVVYRDIDSAVTINQSFAKIDTWTDTWRDMKDDILIDPLTGDKFNFTRVSQILGPGFDSTNTRPGYSDSSRRYALMQSRRVFRYQPGRISGFTFGLRSSVEPVTGIVLEWGIANPTDQYVFRVDAGQFSIVRRSTVPLELSVLERNGLTNEDQRNISSGDPFDGRDYWTINIPRDKFNGDPLNSNGPSGYLLQPQNVTMYKIEFGWYGAIGVRFYAYIPTSNGDARWVVVHTIVIENSLGSPCLEDSYFRFKYSLSISDTGDVRTPQYLYKYGASYYIDGGDEGTSTINSIRSKDKTTTPFEYKSLIGLSAKDVLYNSVGVGIKNRKLLIPTELNVSADSLNEVKIVTCAACPGFGHVYTPGVASTESGRNIEIEFIDASTISAINDSYFTVDDIGAKLIAPSIYNAYIGNLSGPIGGTNSFTTASIEGLTGISNFTLGSRDIGGKLVLDRVTGVSTTVPVGIGSTYPYPVRLSQYSSYVASDFPLNGSEIEILFANPITRDSYAHFSDFLIGVTDKKPQTFGFDELEGFIINGQVSTRLSDSDVLYGEHTHSYAAIDEDGIETGESYAPTQYKMGLDYRIPYLSNPGGGVCSKLTVKTLAPLEVRGVNEFDYRPGSIDQTPDPQGRRWIQIPGSFPAVDYNGGEVVILEDPDDIRSTVTTGARYVGITSSYTAGGNLFSYIQISQTLGQSVGENFTIAIKPVQITGNRINASKLFNYNPFPLFFVVKMRDNASVNNIVIKETIGDYQRTVSPRLYALNAQITDADGNADLNGSPPTNFIEEKRTSSALVDLQNEQKLRPYTVRDTFYVGGSETQRVSLKKTFGQDRNVITPDNNNLEAVFVIAKKIDTGGTGTIQATLNFKEQ